MATFTELTNRVKFTVDTSGFRMPVNFSKLLHESENEFIRKTLCTQTQIDIRVEASTVAFDGTVTNVAFVKGSGSTRDTVTDSDNGLVTDGFLAGMQLVVAGSTSNNNTYTIYSVAVGTITLTSIGQLTSESGVSGMTMKANQIPYLVTLPTNFVKEFRVEYRGIVLEPLNQQSYAQITKSTNAIQTGTPYFYWIQNTDQLELIPKPLQAGTLRFWYCYYQTDNTITSPIIPALDHYLLIDHTIAIIYEMDQKHNIADRYYAKFEKSCQEARLRYARQRHKQRRIVDSMGGEGIPKGIENWINIISES